MTCLQTSNFNKKRLRQRCFPVNIAKFSGTSFSIEHFRWLFLMSAMFMLMLLSKLLISLGHLREQELRHTFQNSTHLFRKGNNDIETAILFLPLPKLCQSGEVLFKKIKTFNRKNYQSINVTFFIWRTWLLSFCSQSSWWWSHNWLFYHFSVLSFVSLFF